jgi:hypothetical protein
MPITSVRCPACGPGQPLSHFLLDCPAGGRRRAEWNMTLAKQLKDTRHRDGKLTVTRLQSCQRQWLIADFCDYEFDPLGAHTPTVGTVWGDALEKHMPEGWRSQVEVEGRLFGLHVTAAIDSLGPNVEIEDGKFRTWRAWGWKKSKDAWLGADDEAQLAMQRLLLRQPGVNKLVQGTMDDPATREDVAMQRDEAWLAAYHPRGGNFAMRDLAGFAQATLAYIAAGTPPAEAIAKYPKSGKSMFNNRGCEYCALGIKGICDGMPEEAW